MLVDIPVDEESPSPVPSLSLSASPPPATHATIKPEPGLELEVEIEPEPSSSSFAEQRRRRDYGRICLICGDQASGFHYDVPSCNGCKTFFRRSVINNRVFRCLKNGKCRFDRDLRCCCRACRFARCKEVGMNAKAIQLPSPSRRLAASHSRQTAVISQAMHVHSCVERLRASSFAPFLPDIGLEQLLRLPSCYGIAQRYPLVVDWPRRPPKMPHMSMEEYRESLMASGIKFWFFLDLYVSVDYLKTFESFHQMRPEIQRLWAKKTAVTMSLLTLAFHSFEQKSDEVVYPDGFSRTNVPANVPSWTITSHGDPGKDLIVSFIFHRPDKVEFALLKAILALSIEGLPLTESERESVEEERNSFLGALFLYTGSRAARYGSLLSLGDAATRATGKAVDKFVLVKTLRGEAARARLVEEIHAF